MNKNFRVITINGIRGMAVVVFLVLGLIAGFIISPGWVCMKVWNYFFENSSTVALMNIYQGVMLWAIIALSLYALNNRRALIGFGSYHGLSPEQINDIMQRTKDMDIEKIKIFDSVKKEISPLKEEHPDGVLNDNRTVDESKEKAEK